MTHYNKISDTQQQVDTVVDIMKNNIEKILDRDEKLTDLENRTDELRYKASRFEKVSTKLKHKMCCKNIRFIIILASGFLILILIILLIIFKN